MAWVTVQAVRAFSDRRGARHDAGAWVRLDAIEALEAKQRGDVSLTRKPAAPVKGRRVYRRRDLVAEP